MSSTASAKTPKVVGFSTHFSGPVACRQLTQLGADVIKIEHPKIGDGNRDLPPHAGEDNVHHLYLNICTLSHQHPGRELAAHCRRRRALGGCRDRRLAPGERDPQRHRLRSAPRA